MTIFTVCNIKGGTGKTTTAVHLAVYLVKRGYKVALIDCDNQQSASTWVNSIADIEVETYCSTDIDEIEDAIFKYKNIFDGLVIDTPGLAEDLIRTIIPISDSILIPCIPASMDITSAERTIKQVVRARRRSACDIAATVILNQANSRTVLTRNAKDFFSKIDNIFLSEVEIPVYQTLKSLPGQGKTVFNSQAKKNLEFSNLYSSLFDNLAGVKK